MNKKIIIPIITVILAIMLCLSSAGVLAVGGAIVGAIMTNRPEYATSSTHTDPLAEQDINAICNSLKNDPTLFSVQNISADAEGYGAPIGLFENVPMIENMKKDAKKLSNTIISDLWEIVVKHAEISPKNTDDRPNISATSSQSVAIKINSHSMDAIITEVYYYFRYSQDIIGFLYKYECVFAPMLEDFYNKNQHTCLADAYRDTMEKSEYNVLFARRLLNNELRSIDITIVVPKLFFKLLNI